MTYIWWADSLLVALAKARFVLGIQKQYEGQIQVGKTLPPQYACALVLLEKALTDLFEGQLLDLVQLRHISKTFEKKSCGREGKHPSQAREEMFRTRPLLWNVIQLPLKRKTNPGSRWFLSFVDYLVAHDTDNDQAPVDDLLALHFSNMMVADDILAAVQSHRPRPDVADDDETLLQWMQAKGNTSGRKPTGFCLWQGTRGWPSLKPILDLPLPSSKLSRTAMTQHKDIRHAAEQIWDSLGDLLRSDFSPKGTDVEYPEIMARYTHTQKYKDDVEHEYRRFEQALTDKDSYGPNPFTWYQLTFIPQRRRRHVVHRHLGPPHPNPFIESRPKIKTRKAEVDSTTFGEADGSRHATEPPVSRFTVQVKRETKEIFDKMYPIPGAQLSDVSWEEFVAAMVDTGCSIKPSRGSAFTFTNIRDRKASLSSIDAILIQPSIQTG
ncbi:hypothetical protein LTS10_007189 [Elasticomyces elasticus]|nr:hypothetical protein LTS10_007189 [Elasticomyces elasticus]